MNFKIIGIDLAGKPENPTGICFLNDNKFNFLTLFSDNDILDYISNKNPYLVVIDAPLSLPKGRCCLSNKCSCSKNGGHFRTAEIEIRRYGRTLPLTFRGMRMLTERGIKLSNNLRSNYEVIESHPRTIEKILDLKNPGYIKKYYQLPPHLSEHELDAALLALNGIFYLKSAFMQFEDPEEGLIIFPDANKENILSF